MPGKRTTPLWSHRVSNPPPPPPPVGEPVVKGTWVLQEINSLATVDQQGPAIRNILLNTDVTGFSCRFRWDAYEKTTALSTATMAEKRAASYFDTAFLDECLAIAEDTNKPVALRFMAGRNTPEWRKGNTFVYDGSQGQGGAGAGAIVPLPFSSDGTPNNIFVNGWKAVWDSLKTYCDSNGIQFLHGSWVGLLYAEIALIDQIVNEPGYSFAVVRDVHLDLMDHALNDASSTFYVEFPLSGYLTATNPGGNLGGEILNNLEASAKQPYCFIQLNNVDDENATGTVPGLLQQIGDDDDHPKYGAQMVGLSNTYDWLKVYQIVRFGTWTHPNEFAYYLEVYTASFSGGTSAQLLAEVTNHKPDAVEEPPPPPTTSFHPVTGTWSIAQVATLTELQNAKALFDTALDLPGVTGIGIRVPVTAIEKGRFKVGSAGAAAGTTSIPLSGTVPVNVPAGTKLYFQFGTGMTGIVEVTVGAGGYAAGSSTLVVQALGGNLTANARAGYYDNTLLETALGYATAKNKKMKPRIIHGRYTPSWVFNDGAQHWLDSDGITKVPQPIVVDGGANIQFERYWRQIMGHLFRWARAKNLAAGKVVVPMIDAGWYSLNYSELYFGPPVQDAPLTPPPDPDPEPNPGTTTLTKDGKNWRINGTLVNNGRQYGVGQLFGYRWVQALFDEENPPAADTYAYNGRFDRVGTWVGQNGPDRNTDELIQHLPTHRQKGIRAFSICMQGGALMDTGLDPPNKYLRGDTISAWNANGTMKTAWRDRLINLLEAADTQGMVVQIQCFYRTRLDILADNNAVLAAMQYMIRLLKDPNEAGKPAGRVYRNVIMEVCNELTSTPHTIINDANLMATINSLKSYLSTNYPGEQLFWSTSRGSGYNPTQATASAFDYWALQSGGTGNASDMGSKIDAALAAKFMPVIVSEAVDTIAWPKLAMAVETKNVGFYLYDQPGPGVMSGGGDQSGPIHNGDGTYTTEGGDYELGYQSPPVNWNPASSPYKTSYLNKINEYATGVVDPDPDPDPEPDPTLPGRKTIPTSGFVTIQPGNNTISNAIANNSAGTKFKLLAGNYTQSVQIQPKAGMWLFCDSPGAASISGSVGTGISLSASTKANPIVLINLKIGNFNNSALQTNDYAVIQACEIHNCPENGIGGNAPVGYVIQDCNIHHNGSNAVQGNNGGGVKIAASGDRGRGPGGLLRGNWVHHNEGNGLWIDVDGGNCYNKKQNGTFFAIASDGSQTKNCIEDRNGDGTINAQDCFDNPGDNVTMGSWTGWTPQMDIIEDNICDDNSSRGIFYEVSRGPCIIRRNTCRRNNTDLLGNAAGIGISATKNTLVEDNICTNNNRGNDIRVGQITREPCTNRPWQPGWYKVRNVVVRNNKVTTSQAANISDTSLGGSNGVVFSNNTGI